MVGNDIDAISLGPLKRYLKSVGWLQSKLGNGLEVFSFGSSNDPIEIVLPATSIARDARARLAGAVSTLSAMEQRSTDEVIAAIRAISYDLIRSRLPNSIIRHDTIKMGAADEFIRRMTRLLAASAHSELHTDPYFVRIDATAQRFAENCRFGHTFRGSFGFTIEAPVGPNTLDNLDEEAPVPPLERRAVHRLARGLLIAEDAIKSSNPYKITESYKFGLNANACDELLSIIENPSIGSISFDFVFSPEWGIPADVGQNTHILISGNNAVEMIKFAAVELRRNDYEKTKVIIGNVIALHSRDNPSDLFSISGSQDIILEYQNDDFQIKRIRVSLTPTDYLQAVEAHKSGRLVSIRGEIEQRRRQWKLTQARDFKLI